MKKCVVILSGGLDSTTTAFIAKNQGYQIIPVHFNYSQRTEKRELKAFNDICDYLKIETNRRYVINLDFFKKIGSSALLDKSIDIPLNSLNSDEIPITYVPFRNGIFLSIAASIAEKENAESIFIGVVEEDSSGYPDCREDFIFYMQEAINRGTKPSTHIRIQTPLIHLKKEDIVKEALKFHVPLHLTWSCYKNEDEACGECDSCKLRLKGFANARVKDPIPYKGDL